MSKSTADEFFDRVETFLTKIALELGLGTAKGPFISPLTGTTRSFTIFGTYEKLWIALTFEASETALSVEQARLRWYVTDSLVPMDLTRPHGRPLILRIVREFSELEHDVRLILGFLHNQSIEDVIEQLFSNSFTRVKESENSEDDPNNTLPS